MAIPTPDLLGLYYASRDLSSSGATSPDRIVGSGATQMIIPITNVTDPDGYWNGATGYFSGTGTTATLRGVTFHVRKWESATKKLTLTAPLPIAPVAGDTLKMFKGGKFASSQEILSMKISGKQPEVENVTGPNVTGITVKKASALLGEGTLSVYYVASTKAVSIRMGSASYGPETFLTADATNVAVYNSDLSGFILIDVVYASLRPSSSYTDTYTLTFPKGNFIPNMEGFETNDGIGRTRYHLAVLKNKSTNPLDAMAALSIWTGKPAGVSTTCTSTYYPSYTAASTIATANASTWPTRGFWVRNKTKNDLRYIDYRSGNTLYAKAILWGVIPFKSGSAAITPGMTITGTGTTDEAIVDQVVISGGTWAGGNATGTLYVKKMVGDWSADEAIRVGGTQYAAASAVSVKGFRGKTAQTWNNNDVLELASDLDVGINYPSGGFFKDPENENIAPDSVEFNLCQSQEEAAIVESLMGGAMVGIWIRQNILDGTQARTDVEGDLMVSWF